MPHDEYLQVVQLSHQHHSILNDAVSSSCRLRRLLDGLAIDVEHQILCANIDGLTWKPNRPPQLADSPAKSS